MNDNLNTNASNEAESPAFLVGAVRRSYSFKAMKLKFWLRLFAMFDVIFSERFELTTWNKKGEQKAKTKFCKSEIDNAGRSGLL
ncbi:hypothetical protein NA63_1767 [Flavobacteriaceae bacterium MAR_2010_105]|nr:hypothetical protein NA63_1767 [Flavobacteriaceae bacterium MAR_2010_105]